MTALEKQGNENWRIVFKKKDEGEFVVEFKDAVVTIGRAPGNLIVIPDERIAPFHVKFLRDALTGNCRILGLASCCGTFLNGKEIQESPLRRGDIVRIGEWEGVFEPDPREPEPAPTYDVDYYVLSCNKLASQMRWLKAAVAGMLERKALVEGTCEDEEERLGKLQTERKALNKEVLRLVAERDKLQADQDAERKSFQSDMASTRAALTQAKQELIGLDAARVELAMAKQEMADARAVAEELKSLRDLGVMLKDTDDPSEKRFLSFVNDIFDRFELLETLSEHCRSRPDGEWMDQQLRGFRSAMLDLLAAYGIGAYDVPAGAELNLKIRQKILIVENKTPSKSATRVLETSRLGFIYTSPSGREMILRKAEVVVDSFS